MARYGVAVVKIGGSIASRLERVADEIAVLAREGLRLVVVHGGGKVVDEYSRRMGVEPRYVLHPSGVRSRYTSWEELEVYVMVMAGLLATSISSELASRGLKVLSLTGLDGLSVEARRRERIVIVNERGRPQAIPGGYTGKIERVDSMFVGSMLQQVDVILYSPVAYGREGDRVVALNVDGDQMAASLSAALKAPLALVTDVPGVILDGRVVDRIRVSEAREIAAKAGVGMNRKILMAAKAVSEGSPYAAIGDPPIQSLINGEKGTLVTRS
ncbi:acetylaminoadipate kinase/acetylglutamate kinase [Aeropyrum pernix K1]|uniref:Putative [LysW]-aminoadipate/[LysW]-glutamate kinase n=1 Tax=Aeropyrum pernix (strain ATCC 700893 / DSM 11879 / JCM 9820 / NBRC 100138 / K1) TaxID=272557 RepID=LYSZ_AERPE|nr:[LysW]-aminoadipate/[LysW]-glutamate kinase [Aeropyrum pernix]Q9YBY9.2 RecName: Full=Putative [LysW]-aminoadipate/[LysW]-glutamate kinase [Aeropyrum pernix K1]BAA80459.2 acetylaminoadipate kinase/acetylglutamate kinase [Aeropyrum pernix K1]